MSNSANDTLCVVRGGGDLATGVVWRLQACGYRVLVTELSHPLTIRRTVAVSSAIADGSITIEGLRAVRAESDDDVVAAFTSGHIPVVVAPSLNDIPIPNTADVVVDARMAKRPLDCRIDDAAVVIGLGPGYVVGEHCHAVIETQRGHRLGRAIFTGAAAPNTGVPGAIHGQSSERVIRASTDGIIAWHANIADHVRAGDIIGNITGVSEVSVNAPFDGVIRGLVAPGTPVHDGLKIADVDPRDDTDACFEISDKALAIGGGVVEAVQRLLAAS